MGSADEIRNAVAKWVKVLENPEVANEFGGYNKTMQFVFPDIDLKLLLVFEGAKTKIIDGLKQDADMSLTVNSDLFLGISSGEIDPVDAFMEGQLKPTGDMADLEKLQILLGE